ncbi:MAG TPA: queuosine salvage family protein [Ktedonobacteraceae bacterium]|nr:queuosine salvage family protein [Ktedonobacteraceae bacterium]
MVDFSTRPDDEEELYTLPNHDPLGILSSTQRVVQQSKHVWINPEYVEQLSEQWLQEDTGNASTHPPLWDDRYHFHDGTERTVNWLLVLDALNFCFWPEKGQPRWSIEYRGETLNGYWAEAAALKRAVEEGIPLWDAKTLSTIGDETVAHIFRSNGGIIPLFERRVSHAREVGRVLLEHYDGQFVHAIEQAESSAIKLVELLIRDFPSFRDITTYHTHPVKFLKRAQICVADVYNAFGGQQWGTFADLEQLTIFADYKLPQVLRHYHVLEYDSTLAQRIDNQELLPGESEEEVEIRAATIWACELLHRTIQQRGYAMTSADIDQRLWLMGQQSTEMRPYHRTRTIYY